MPVSPELLNTTLADLRGPIEHTFEQKTPLHALIEKKGKVSTDRGTSIKRSIMGGSPAKGKAIITGGEVVNLTSADKTKGIEVETHRVMIPLVIPKKALRANEGKLGAIKIIETHVAAVQKLLPADFDRYLFTGVSHGFVLDTSEMTGWNTLNGQKTGASGLTGVTSGLLEFTDIASQSTTRQNLAASTAYNYVNQFGEITSYAGGGRKVYKKVYRDVAQFNPTDMNAGPDVGFMDFDSFALLEEEQEGKVRIVTTQTNTDKSGNLMELMLGNARILAAKNIVLTDFNGAAASGICYFLTLEGWEWVWYQKPEMTDFADNTPNMDVVTAKMELQGCPLVTGMRMQGVVVGGARP